MVIARKKSIVLCKKSHSRTIFISLNTSINEDLELIFSSFESETKMFKIVELCFEDQFRKIAKFHRIQESKFLRKKMWTVYFETLKEF